jgi:hypothetical protein
MIAGQKKEIDEFKFWSSDQKYFPENKNFRRGSCSHKNNTPWLVFSSTNHMK